MYITKAEIFRNKEIKYLLNNKFISHQICFVLRQNTDKKILLFIINFSNFKSYQSSVAISILNKNHIYLSLVIRYIIPTI